MSRPGTGQFLRLHVRRNGTVTFRPALGRRTRLRLVAHRRIDRVCDRLLDHGHEAAAISIWRACGMWGG